MMENKKKYLAVVRRRLSWKRKKNQESAILI